MRERSWLTMTHPALQTRVTSLLGIRYPIIQAGMGFGIATPELVAAVSNAGGLGIFGAMMVPPDAVRAAVENIRTLTDRPFGVNVVLAPPDGELRNPASMIEILNRYRADLGLPTTSCIPDVPPSTTSSAIEAVLAAGVPVLSTGLGDPAPYVDRAHERGAKVIAMVSTVSEARVVEKAGVDIIAAQGYDAGGHRSNLRYSKMPETPMIGTFALIPQVVDAVDVPVLAAGGVMDGRGLAAALALGAEGVLVGTRFLTARESGIFPSYRQALFDAVDSSTVVSDAPTGRPARSIRNRLTDDLGRASLPYPAQAFSAMDVYKAAWAQDRADLFPLWAGQGLRLATKEQPAAAIVEEMVRQAGEILGGTGQWAMGNSSTSS
jgi:nitronate monooxygenase